MPKNLLLLVLIGVPLVGVAGWLLLESRSFESATAETTLDELFEDADILRVPHPTEAVDFTLADLNGHELRLSHLRGNIVFLNFWTTWCPPCRTEMADMEKLYQKFKVKQFAMVAVSLQETAEVVKRFVESHQLNFVTVLDPDGEVGRRFRIRSIPTTYILNTRGQITGAALGPRKWTSRDMIALFEHLTAEPTAGHAEATTN